MEVVRGRFTSGAREDRARHLWGAWLEAVQGLRPACSRTRTFLWLVLVLAGFCLRPDLAGVTSLVRGLGLAEPSYFCLLHFFHSAAVHPEALTQLWVAALLQRLGPHLVRVQGRPVAVGAGHHLVTRAHTNAVAYFPPEPPKPRRPKRRGRPRTDGLKTHLRDWFNHARHFRRARSPVYGETDVWLSLLQLRPALAPGGPTGPLRLGVHPTRGRLILLCTDLPLDPLEIIRLDGWRFKIEVSFKAAIHTLGTYAYHFWMRTMKPIRRGGSDQPLRHRSAAYRQAVGRKLAAYHLHIQLGLIAQGLLQYLAVAFRPQVWAQFPSYLRTASPQNSPSEWVTAQALRHSWPQFLRDLPRQHILKKFLVPKIKPNPCPYAELVQMEEAA